MLYSTEVNVRDVALFGLPKVLNANGTRKATITTRARARGAEKYSASAAAAPGGLLTY